MQVKEETRISLTFLHFSVSCLFVLWLKRRFNLRFLDIAGLQHRGEQASPVFCRLGFGPQ